MAKPAKAPSIRPLLTVTLLASICVIVPGETLASDLSEKMTFPPTTAGDNRQSHSASPSADTVADARWARSQDDYVLGRGGRIAPETIQRGVIAAPSRHAQKDGKKYNQFGSITRNGTAECGPSPATLAEITRLVVEAAQRHNVDIGFALAVVTAESRLDQVRNSPRGARGPMQLMPETAKRFDVTDICDPEDNIDGGVRYLRELADEFGNPMLVAAAYNAGEGRVREHGGIPPFKETLGYVAEVLNIQMGLEGNASNTRGRFGSTEDPKRPSNVSGVIEAPERRQWVGGVMHF